MTGNRDTRMGRLGVEKGYFTEEQLGEALEEQERSGEDAPPLGAFLVNRGDLTEARLRELLQLQKLERIRFAIDGYELLDRLGQGSMGVVYRARQISLERIVAIKILSPRFAGNPGYVDWFLKEARTVARLNHPNIIGGIDSGEASGYRYFVMEYVDGPTVADLVLRGGAMDEARAVEFVVQIVQALDYAHRNRLVHRDVKPHNVIIAPGGVAKLCDLGLARSPRHGKSIRSLGIHGTPHYISPEQVRGLEEIDIRSDIYSLGMTFYHMLTGKVPFEGPNRSATMAMHLTKELGDLRDERADLHPRTCKIVRLMTMKDPRHRYADPAALLKDLELARSELTLRDSSAHRSPPVKRRRRR